MEPPDCSRPEELHPVLIDLFQRHGVAAQADGDWVNFPDHTGKVQGLVFELNDVHRTCSTQVDIRFSPWPGCLICESFGGIADSRQQRVGEALAVFAQNSLHVLLKVFLDIDCGEHTEEWSVVNQGVRRAITHGHAFCRGTGPFKARLDWVKGFQRMLASVPLSEGTHWLRLYVAQLDRQPHTLELLLDNEPWSAALPTARSLRWPRASGFFSVRMFLVIQGGLEVSRAIGVLAQNAEADDGRLEELLVERGFSTIDARRIIVLAPIAFGGRVLERLGIAPPTVCTLDDGVSCTPIDLQTSPIFQESRSTALNALENGVMTRDEFFAIAGRDASLKAVNTALTAGSKPEDLKLTGPVIAWREAVALCVPSKIEPAPMDNAWERFWRRSGRGA
jgi:hypothetical protein